jgi:protein SCO1/2
MRAFCVRVFIVLSVALGGAMAVAPAKAAPAGSPWGEAYFGDPEVIDQNGVTHKFYSDLVKDKLVIVNFMFTHCESVCPLMTSRMAELQRRLGDHVGKDVFIYSVTMDPARDTPEVLKDYSAAFDVGPGWLFLSGKAEDLAILRAKLGERAQGLSAHRTEAALGNDRTGQWTKLSAFEDYDFAVNTVLDMDPKRLASPLPAADTTPVTPRDARRPGEALFAKACSACHSIGHGDRIGPDLKDVALRRSKDWLTRFIMTPDIMRATKDPVTLELMAKYKNVRMPNIGLADTDTADLLSYITHISGHLTQQAKADSTAPAPTAKSQ